MSEPCQAKVGGTCERGLGTRFCLVCGKDPSAVRLEAWRAEMLAQVQAGNSVDVPRWVELLATAAPVADNPDAARLQPTNEPIDNRSVVSSPAPRLDTTGCRLNTFRPLSEILSGAVLVDWRDVEIQRLTDQVAAQAAMIEQLQAAQPAPTAPILETPAFPIRALRAGNQGFSPEAQSSLPDGV